MNKGRRQGFPYEVRLSMLHWLPVNKRIVFKVLMLVFKCLNNQAPHLVSSLLSINNSSREAGPNILSIRNLYPLTNYGKRAFVYYAPRLWNGIPSDLRVINELSSFKRKLKTYLFSTSYDTLMNRFNRYRE